MDKFEMSYFVLDRDGFQLSAKGGNVNFITDFVSPVAFVLKKVSEVSTIDVESQVRIEVAIVSCLVDRD